MVILLINPTLGAKIGGSHQAQERLGVGDGRRDRARINAGRLGRRDRGAIIQRRRVAKLLDRQIGFKSPAMGDREAQAVRRLADDGEIEPPFAKDRLGLRLPGWIEHHQHPLLAFGKEHFVGSHAGLPAGHSIEIERDPQVALSAHFDRRGGEARRAHVLDRDDGAGLHQFEARLEQQLFGERITDLHRWAFCVRVCLERRRGHGRAMDAVAAGFRAEIDDFVADPARLRVENLAGFGDAHRHGINENISVIARVEIGRSADGRHPKAVAIGANPGDDTRDKMARARMVRRAKTQQVQAGHGPRAHREDIAQDAANPCRGTLKRLDIGGVIVALHLEDAGKPVTDVDDTGVFPRALNDPGRLGGKSAQMFP